MFPVAESVSAFFMTLLTESNGNAIDAELAWTAVPTPLGFCLKRYNSVLFFCFGNGMSGVFNTKQRKILVINLMVPDMDGMDVIAVVGTSVFLVWVNNGISEYKLRYLINDFNFSTI